MFWTTKATSQFAPAATDEGAVDAAELRSLERTTGVVMRTELLPDAGSVEALLATRVDVKFVPAVAAPGKLKLMVKLPLSPASRAPSGQESGFVPVHVMDALANVVPDGTGTETATAEAFEGPLLVTDALYVNVEPAVAFAGPDAVRTRSLERRTVVDADFVLSDGTVSVEVLDATSVEASTVLAAVLLGTEKTTVKDVAPPRFRVPTLHVRVLPPTHAIEDETYAVPDGTGTATSTLSARDGPLLVTPTV
jgi:hypothetical protein